MRAIRRASCFTALVLSLVLAKGRQATEFAVQVSLCSRRMSVDGAVCASRCRLHRKSVGSSARVPLSVADRTVALLQSEAHAPEIPPPRA